MSSPHGSRTSLAPEILAFVEAYVGSLFDYLPAALVMTDADGLIVRANPGAARLLSRGVLVGLQVWEVVPFLTRPLVSGGAWVGRLRQAAGNCVHVRCGGLGSPTSLLFFWFTEVPARGADGQTMPRVTHRRSRFAPTPWAHSQASYLNRTDL